MTPPDRAGAQAQAGAMAAPAVSVCPATELVSRPGLAASGLSILRQRKDFLRTASARRQSTPAFLLQARDRNDGDASVRVGFTCSRKVGNAVARNRAKRRLREVARLTLPACAKPGWDYVLVGRPEVTASRNFSAMRDDLAKACARIHG